MPEIAHETPPERVFFSRVKCRAAARKHSEAEAEPLSHLSVGTSTSPLAHGPPCTHPHCRDRWAHNRVACCAFLSVFPYETASQEHERATSERAPSANRPFPPHRKRSKNAGARAHPHTG
eukprot:scaffold4558_cov117-Isochrysis_galbana.AAC.2